MNNWKTNIIDLVLLNKQHKPSNKLWKVKNTVVESRTRDLVVHMCMGVIPLNQRCSWQTCFEQASEARLPRGNRVLYIININNQPPADRVDPVAWNRLRTEIMPPGHLMYGHSTLRYRGVLQSIQGSCALLQQPGRINLQAGRLCDATLSLFRRCCGIHIIVELMTGDRSWAGVMHESANCSIAAGYILLRATAWFSEQSTEWRNGRYSFSTNPYPVSG